MQKNSKNLFNLKNKIILITGGSGYLGSEFSFAVSDMGAIPVVLDKNKKSINLLKNKFFRKKKEGSFYFIDINDENEINNLIKQIIKKYQKIDCLINSAAYTMNNMLKKNNFFERFEKYDFELWKQSLEGNLSGIFVVTKSVVKYMLKRKTGSIINIASDVGIISPDHRIYEPDKNNNYKGVNFNIPASYPVAKSGIISLTRYLATYWAKSGIRVNCISPTGVYKNQNKKFVKKLSERIPLGRMAKSHEINGAVIFLCSSASSFVTGHNLVVDGGRTIW